jgi:hypothetical protein
VAEGWLYGGMMLVICLVKRADHNEREIREERTAVKW